MQLLILFVRVILRRLWNDICLRRKFIVLMQSRNGCAHDRLHVFTSSEHCISPALHFVFMGIHFEIIDISCGENSKQNVDASHGYAEIGPSVICQTECIA